MSFFLFQLRAELRKMFARKRTYIGFAVFLLVETATLIIMQLPKSQKNFQFMIERAGYAFEKYNSGLTLAFSILFSTVVLLTSLYLALVGGDVVSKEVEEGTMRMILCRPVSRLRMLALKYVACAIYTLALLNFIGLTALAAGILKQGMGGLFVFIPTEGVPALFDFWPGLWRYLGSLQLLALCLLTVTSISFMLSCWDMKPAAATIITLSYIIVDILFAQMPYFASIRNFLLSTHMSTWYNVFHAPVHWPVIVEDITYLLGVDATVVIIGAMVFLRRDLKS